MTPDQWFQTAYTILAAALVVGAWWGRRQAAEKAAAIAVEHIRERFDEKVNELERRIEASDEQRQREYDNLHAKAGETQKMLADLFKDLMDRFAQRPEFDRLDRTVDELVRRFNQVQDRR